MFDKMRGFTKKEAELNEEYLNTLFKPINACDKNTIMEIIEDAFNLGIAYGERKNDDALELKEYQWELSMATKKILSDYDIR